MDCIDYLCITSKDVDGVLIAAITRNGDDYAVGLVVDVDKGAGTPIIQPMKPVFQQTIAEGYAKMPDNDRYNVGQTSYRRLSDVSEVVESFEPQNWFEQVLSES